MFLRLYKLFFFLDIRLKLKIIYVALLAAISAILELIIIASLIPFLSALIDHTHLVKLGIFEFLSNYFVINAISAVQIIGLGFIVIILLGGILRIVNVKENFFLASEITSFLSRKCFKNIISQEYEYYLKVSSNEIISLLTQQLNRTAASISTALTMFSSLVLIIILSTGYIIIDPLIATYTSLFILLAYTFIIVFSKKRLYVNGKIVTNLDPKIVSSIQNPLGSIKEIILSNTEESYTINYFNLVKEQKSLQANNQFLSIFPRYLLESIGFIFIAALGIFLSLKNESGSSTVLPRLGALAVISQRLLPSAQQIYGGLSTFKGFAHDIDNIIHTLENLTPASYISIKNFERTVDWNKLEFLAVSYAYPTSNEKIIDNKSFSIRKGEKIGIVGKTGSGKSTFINLLIGLLNPTCGSILIDGKDIYAKENTLLRKQWLNNISFVPQDTFLFDSTIGENIALNSVYDSARLEKAARLSCIHDYIINLPNKYQTVVGERGINLSGGQKQRIAIARALYNESSLLILDEATSSLDNTTEAAVMRNINSMNISIVMIAHRLSTLEKCDRIFDIQND